MAMFEIDCGDIGGEIFCGGEMGGVSRVVYNKSGKICKCWIYSN